MMNINCSNDATYHAIVFMTMNTICQVQQTGLGYSCHQIMSTHEVVWPQYTLPMNIYDIFVEVQQPSDTQ